METKDNKNIRPNQFYETELWQLFKHKADENGHPIAELKEFCENAEKLSKEININFPYFTLHDNTHIAGVCKWMYLLLGDKAELISMEESALLLMAACCHDLGMLIGENEETELIAQAKSNYGNWKEYFERHPNDREKLVSKKTCHDVVINYVRENHHLRVENIISSKLDFSHDFFLDWGISEEMLIAVCKSHGEKLNDLKLNTENIDVNLCAVLLRLADALDYDSNRAPNILLRFLGLDKKDLPESTDDGDVQNKEAREKSLTEWHKNRAGVFHRSHQRPMTITYRAKCYQPHIEAELNDYLKWLKEELQECYNFVEEYCKGYSDKDNNPIPLILKSKIDSKGYDSAEIRLMMDQNRVLELLSGEELYGEQGVFVRELLQNSIDAVLMRCECDESFSLEQGKIDVDVWTDKEDGRYFWFRIKDNGIGMDKKIVQKYFLNVARSYYNDEEGYIQDLLRQGKKVSSFKPISRFGIGILSCFMGEGKNNRMEISTKRYSFGKSKPSNPVRLDITGLNGYYYLTELSEVKKGEPMPQPPRESAEFEYMRDEGTTICLRLDLYNSSISSFRELLDKYIRFPKINISFTDHRTAENKTYPTQQELETLLDKLNPDFDKTGEVTKHVHRMKQEDFEELKNKIPEADWSNIECPNLVIRYWPLHRLSPAKELSGAIICFECHCPDIPLRKDLDSHLLKKIAGYKDAGKISKCVLKAIPFINAPFEYSIAFSLRVDGSLSFSKAVVLESALETRQVRFPVAISDTEKCVHRLINNGEPCLSFNGISASNTPLVGYTSNLSTHILMLNGNFRPDVGIARDGIRNLPFEARCAIELAFACINIPFAEYRHYSSRTVPISMYYEFFKKFYLLDCHPSNPVNAVLHGLVDSVDSSLSNDNRDISRFTSRYLESDLFIAFLRKKGYLFFQYEDEYYLKKDSAIAISDPYGAFPVRLFAHKSKSSKLGIMGDWNYFSPTHPFSQWLIENRALLQKDVPSVYDRIIDSMVGSTAPKKLTLTLNMILDQLRNLPNNPFKVPHDLRIEEWEITKYD